VFKVLSFSEYADEIRYQSFWFPRS